jgi:hypothetical protein
MPFNNLLLALALTVLWPLGLMGLLAAAEWLERRTLAPVELAPRRLRPAADGAAETMPSAAVPAEPVREDADDVATAAWPAAEVRGLPGGAQGPVSLDDRDVADGERLLARRAGGGGRHLRRADGGRGGGRHERRR